MNQAKWISPLVGTACYLALAFVLGDPPSTASSFARHVIVLLVLTYASAWLLWYPLMIVTRSMFGSNFLITLITGVSAGILSWGMFAVSLSANFALKDMLLRYSEVLPLKTSLWIASTWIVMAITYNLLENRISAMKVEKRSG